MYYIFFPLQKTKVKQSTTTSRGGTMAKEILFETFFSNM